MLFNSLEFLFVFTPLTLIVFWAILKKPTARLYAMNIASFIFYGAWNYKFLPLLIFSTWFDFHVAKKMYHLPQDQRKKWVTMSVLVNLGLLGFFKYFYFFTDSAFWILDYFDISYVRPTLEIVLPVGISFYTFQSMSYTIDVYRSHSKPYTDYKLFTAYVCFFPQLVAGPIVRHNELVGQIRDAINQRFSWHSFITGLHFFCLGLAKKVVIADRLAAGIDPALMQLSQLNSLEATLCAFGYSLQLYFDFSGYSDMAIGLGYFFRLRFPVNFDSPYKSKSITEFWRRWHITLSRWLRDYLYISLGGNRLGTLKTYRNLMLTMLLGGLWHGAGWTYVVWGGYHGLWLVIERLLGNSLWAFMGILKTPITYIIVTIGWIFFRSPDMDFAWLWFERILSFDGGLHLHHFTPKVRDRFAGVFILSTLFLFLPNSQQLIPKAVPSNWRIFAYAFLLYLSLIYMASESPFLYFQF